MNSTDSLIITFMNEWKKIKPALLNLADTIYGMSQTEQAQNINDLLILLQDLTDLMRVLRNQEKCASIVIEKEQELVRIINEIEKTVQLKQMFELGELIRYEIVEYFDDFNKGVGTVVSSE